MDETHGVLLMVSIGDIVIYEGMHWRVMDFMDCWLFGSDESTRERRVLLQDIPATGEKLVPVDECTRVRRH